MSRCGVLASPALRVWDLLTVAIWYPTAPARAPRHGDDPAAKPGRWVVVRDTSEKAGAGHEAAAATLPASGCPPAVVPLRSGAVHALSTSSGNRLISKATTMRITPMATAQIPPTVMRAASVAPGLARASTPSGISSRP